LNDPASRQGLVALPCDSNSNFTIPNVPAGTYQLVTWDKPLDALFGFNTITVPATGSLDLGNVFSFRWFGTLQGSVFYDTNQNGFRDPGEQGISEQTINIRFRDGSMYQTTITDINGEYEFQEVFPFFKWLVTEVDFARFKPTGMTTAVDDGGPIPPENGWIVPSFGRLNPQPQAEINPNTGNNLSRTETGPVLLQAMQLYLNQTNVIDWGKVSYGQGENGGISGIIYYATTRAENDPRYAVGEPWEPGIPRVQVNLYRDSDGDGVIDDLNQDGLVTLSDVDNYPFGNFPGPEDIDRNGNGIFDLGDAVDVTWSDSWDDNKPTGCIQALPPIPGVQPCYDNYGTWNQVRPGVFDGRYAFGFAAGKPHLQPGTYIVEAVPPPGYEIQKEEDKNIDFGDEYRPSLLLLPPVCVGTTANGMPEHVVPAELSLFPGVPVDPLFAGKVTPLCNMKQVRVSNGQNTAADFSMFTEVPKAARVVGFSNNDLAAEFWSGSPVFGEKTAPAWIPVSFQDWQGNEIARVYTDEWGSYNALLPSTFTINPPIPTGVSPNMITVVLNHPIRPDGSIDPFYDPRYSITPWTFDSWPGKVTYLDTPLVPVAAMTGFPANGPDVEFPDGTPVIHSVRNNNSEGPVVCHNGDTLTITSMGLVDVPNPDFDPSIPGSSSKIHRDYGFGSVPGMIKLNGNTISHDSWSDSEIIFTVTDVNAITSGQLMITRGDNGKTTPIGITLHISNNGCSNVLYVSQGNGTPVQNAIDIANDGDLIIVAPGIYKENVILYKDVKLQGSGAGSTIIFANPSPSERLRTWHQKVMTIYGSDPFLLNEAPGILVFGNTPSFPNPPELIDGFQILGAIAGGGIYVYDSTSGLVISNNRIAGNQGNYGGGIGIGSPDIDTNNTGVVIRYNHIIRNGGIQGGGGIAIYTGSDNYTITGNIIGGNFSRFDGGGISHNGLSNNGLISKNRIIFNEVAFGGASFGDGAGIYIGGLAPALTPGPGAGNVTVDSNLIQGNLAGTGSGAGISARYVNGQDSITNPYSLTIINNMIVNNVAGYTGGGIFLQDVVNASIINNTIANNDSTATAANAFQAGSSVSDPQGAGIVSNVHSSGLSQLIGQLYSNPVLQNNIIYNNRSFTFDANAGTLMLNSFWDLWVKGTATPSYLSPQYCLLTNLNQPDGGNYSGNGNIASDPIFVRGYANNIYTASVIDEGGNFVTVRMLPLKTEEGDYHINISSPAKNAGAAVSISYDYDGDTRPSESSFDIGADEFSGYIITATAGTGGSISPSGSIQVVQGGSQTFTIIPDACHNIQDVLVDGQSAGPINSYTFNNVTANHTIEAQFVIKRYSITATAGTGGSINPSGTVLVDCGGSQTFSITPDAGNRITGVMVDGRAVGSLSSYTFNNVVADHTISASFSLAPDIEVMPASLDFGNVKIWKSLEKTLVISNRGPGNLVINRIQITGLDASLFYTSGASVPRTLLSGESANMLIGFRSRPRGLKTATLKIYSNDPDTPILSVPLSGNAVNQ